MKPFRILTIFLFTSAVLNACGASNDGPKRIAPPDEDPQSTNEIKDCITQWQEKISKAPVGEVKVYDYKEVITGSGDLGLDGTVSTRSREFVKSATDEKIVIDTVWEYFEPNLGRVEGSGGITKENFMLTCEPIQGEVKADPGAMAEAGITILENRNETISVKAGNFAVQYQKIQVKNDDGFSSDVLGDHWTMNEGTLIVKEHFVVTSPIASGQMVKTASRELVEYAAP